MVKKSYKKRKKFKKEYDVTILLLGKNSQIGKEFEKIEKTISIDSFKINFESNLDEVDSLIAQLKPDIVINTAAYNKVDQAEKEKEKAYRINSEAPGRIAYFCKKNHIPFIHFSSDFVFDGKKKDTYDEEDLTNPLSFYGDSKLKGEKNIIFNTKNYIIIRTSWVFSSHNNNFVKSIISNSFKNNKLKVVSDEYGCPTSASDLAFLLKTILDHIKVDTFKSGIFNYGGFPFISRYEFAKEILRQYYKKDYLLEKILSKNLKLDATRPKFVNLNCEKIKKIYGISQPNWISSLTKVIHELKI